MRHLRVNVIYFTWCTTLFSTVVQLRNRRKNVIVYIQSMTLFLDALASLKTMFKIKSVIDVFKILLPTEYYRVLQSITEYYRILQSGTEC